MHGLGNKQEVYIELKVFSEKRRRESAAAKKLTSKTGEDAVAVAVQEKRNSLSVEQGANDEVPQDAIAKTPISPPVKFEYVDLREPAREVEVVVEDIDDSLTCRFRAAESPELSLPVDVLFHALKFMRGSVFNTTRRVLKSNQYSAGLEEYKKIITDRLSSNPGTPKSMFHFVKVSGLFFSKDHIRTSAAKAVKSAKSISFLIKIHPESEETRTVLKRLDPVHHLLKIEQRIGDLI